jgi:hypothetical protein
MLVLLLLWLLLLFLLLMLPLQLLQLLLLLLLLCERGAGCNWGGCIGGTNEVELQHLHTMLTDSLNHIFTWWMRQSLLLLAMFWICFELSCGRKARIHCSASCLFFGALGNRLLSLPFMRRGQ